MQAHRVRFKRVLVPLIVLLLVAGLGYPAMATVFVDPNASEEIAFGDITVDPAIHAVWEQTDGPTATGAVSQAWIWGPAPIAAAVEAFPESSTGYREIVYYEKGRLDLTHPDLPEDSIWRVSGALLISEMLSGKVQLGPTTYVERELPDIPIVGDYEQENPVTYASLSKLSSVWQPPEKSEEEQERARERAESTRLSLEQYTVPRYDPRVGAQITELLRPDGSVVGNAVDGYGVLYSSYDETLGHNIASPFAAWADAQPMPWTYLLGLPITEPYWVEATVGGQRTHVLLQAFERRLMTYTPINVEGWQVETGNIGLHYRLWRGLDRPEEPYLAAMASEVPFGEEIIAAAIPRYIDPYMLASVSMNLTAGDPFYSDQQGRQGILAVWPNEVTAELDLRDPYAAAEAGAGQFADWMFKAFTWSTVLADYYSRGNPNWSDAAMNDWIAAVLDTYDELIAAYPPPEDSEIVRKEGDSIGLGHAAYYSPSYDQAWWEHAMGLHASWGNAVDEWRVDPNGYYCVHPNYWIGERLTLRANGVSVECTIGDMVAIPHRVSWRSRWVVELGWDTFTALGLDENNDVEVFYLDLDPTDDHITPTPEPTVPETPEPTMTPPDQIGVQVPVRQDDDPDTPIETPAPMPTETPTTEPTAEPTDPAPEPTSTPTPDPSATATPTPAPPEEASPAPTESTEAGE